MEPIGFELDQVALLPPCELVTYAKDQPKYIPLPTVRLKGKEGRVISRWTFTAEERAKIAAGEDLYLEQLTFGSRLQPILPTIGLRDFCPQETDPDDQMKSPDELKAFEAEKDTMIRKLEVAAMQKMEKAPPRDMDAFPLKKGH